MNDQTRPSVGTAIALPSDARELMALARELSLARLIPPHFQKSPADCWLVMSFCRSRNLDFLMVVGECSVVQGRLFFSGKLTAALLNTSGYLAERLNYEYVVDDKNNTVAVQVSGRIANETSPRLVTVNLEDVKTANKVWTTQPEQQLAYAGARIWGRRHMPEVLMGLMFEGEQPIIDVTPTESTTAQRVAEKMEREWPTAEIAEDKAAATPQHDAEMSSGDHYALRWREVMASASSADELAMQWNTERALRGKIDWNDREQPARVKEMVTRRIEELKAAQDDTR